MKLAAALLAVFVAMATAADDYHYCGHVWSSDKFYQTDLTTEVLSVNFNTRNKCRSDLIIKTTNAITLSRGRRTGTFEVSSTVVATTAFCNQPNDKLYASDFDGDKKDDLLCHLANGKFQIRYYYYHNYAPTQTYAAGYSCGSVSDNALLFLGDFDGNRATDIMCISRKSDLVDEQSSIYFSQACQTHHYYYGNPYEKSALYRMNKYHSNQYHFSHYHTHCPPHLPRTYHFTANTGLSTCLPFSDKIVIADVNGDRRDDIVCQNGGIDYHLATGDFKGNMFQAATTAVAVCPITSGVLHSADVDGDGDDDLVCVSLAPSIQNVQISFSSGGTYQAFTTFDPTTCGSFCSDANTPEVKYIFGNFNEDESDDLMCRYEKNGVIHTDIVFGEKIVA